MAEPAVMKHIKQIHSSNLTQLLYSESKYNTLTQNQRELLAMFYSKISDKDMAKKLNVTEGTIRRQRFTFREKAKQAIVNMGGLIGVKDPEAPYILKIKANCISLEGFYTYGGLNGRDLECLAEGLYEGIDENWLRYRIGTMEYIGERLEEYGIPYQSPVGGHGIFLDAAKFYPQLSYKEFPGQVLAVELYKECGLRACEIGSYMIGNHPDTGEQLKSMNEFTRIAIPRRVYTQSHYDMVIEAVYEVWKRRESVKHGYRIVWEPPVLRHFQADLEPAA